MYIGELEAQKLIDNIWKVGDVMLATMKNEYNNVVRY